MILTSDYATFYSLPPLPFRINLRKKRFPPYGLRKIEALVRSKIVPPESLDTNGVIGIYVNDPFGLTTVSRSLRVIFKTEPYHVVSFKEFSFQIKKNKGNTRVIVGGPGAWQLINEDWIDYVIIGEAEKTLPVLIEKIESGEKLPKIIYTEKAERHIPIKGPSALAEVEVTRKGEKIELEVVRKELEVQSRFHDYVNLISEDLFNYGDEKEILELLRLASLYGKVIFSQISVKSSLSIDLGKVKDILRLNENNWRSPVLSTNSNSCVFKVEKEIIKELNKYFIYPMVFVDVNEAQDLFDVKAVIIPLVLNDNEDLSKILIEIWEHNKRIFNKPLIDVIKSVSDDASLIELAHKDPLKLMFLYIGSLLFPN